MKQRRGFTEVILILLTVLVLLAVFTVLLAMIYPNATKNIIADISQTYESNQGGPIGFMGDLAKRAGDGFNARVAPAINGVGKRLAEIFGRKKLAGTIEEDRIGPPIKAGDCTGCHEHEKLFEQKAYAHIYIDHRLHDAAEVSCRRCHLNTKHPKPLVVKEQVCIDCHKKTRASTDCSSCHPPGSILDSAVIPQAKTDEFLRGSQVTAKSLVPRNFGIPDPQWLKGPGDSPCRGCHGMPDFCNQCHLVFHDKVPSWRAVHGPKLLKQEYVMNVCWTCHSPTWCAGDCHVNAGVRRSGAYLELPKVPLDNYIR